MDKKLIKFVESQYAMAEQVNNSLDIEFYVANCVGACAYEYERTGDWDALNLWRDEWKKKFNKLLEKLA